MAINETKLKRQLRITDATNDLNTYTISIDETANNQSIFNFGRSLASLLIDEDGEPAGASEYVKIDYTQLSQGF